MDEVDDVLPHIASAKTLGEALDGLLVARQRDGVVRIEAIDAIDIADSSNADIVAMFDTKTHGCAQTVTHQYGFRDLFGLQDGLDGMGEIVEGVFGMGLVAQTETWQIDKNEAYGVVAESLILMFPDVHITTKAVDEDYGFAVMAKGLVVNSATLYIDVSRGEVGECGGRGAVATREEDCEEEKCEDFGSDVFHIDIAFSDDKKIT